MLTPKEKEYVRSTINELVKLRKQFTGEDVYKRLNSKYVRGRTERYSCQAPAEEVSRFVRQLFNTGDNVFFGSYYGSAPTHVSAKTSGPLFYFPLPHHAKRYMGSVIDKIN